MNAIAAVQRRKAEERREQFEKNRAEERRKAAEKKAKEQRKLEEKRAKEQRKAEEKKAKDQLRLEEKRAQKEKDDYEWSQRSNGSKVRHILIILLILGLVLSGIVVFVIWIGSLVLPMIHQGWQNIGGFLSALGE